MLRTYSPVIALIAVTCGLLRAQAADTTLTLACKGTANMTGFGDTGPVSMGLVVDLMARVCRQSISDSWLGNLREYLAHLV
jgi:hypothetical protein